MIFKLEEMDKNNLLFHDEEKKVRSESWSYKWNSFNSLKNPEAT